MRNKASAVGKAMGFYRRLIACFFYDDFMKKNISILILLICFLTPSYLGLAEKIEARPFSASDIYDIEHSLSDYDGKTKVLYFWATWCPACRRETNAINALQSQINAKGWEFISVSLDTDRQRLKDYIEQKEIEFPVLFDGGGWQNEVAQIYGVRSTPSYYILGPYGEILAAGSWHKQLQKQLETA